MVTRRGFLKAGGLALFAVGTGGSPLFLSRAALAAAPTLPYKKKKVLVAIFQRGAMDGLMAVTPFEDAYYRESRPRLAMATTGTEAHLIDLDGRFGLHPALGPLKTLFDEKRLAIVHGIGSPNTTRSHFDAQDYMESGTPDRKGTDTGWLNRVAAQVREGATPFQAVAMTPALPRSLYGNAPALAISDIGAFGVRVPHNMPLTQAAGATFESLYDQASQELLRDTGRESFEAIDMLRKIDVAHYVPSGGAEYPASQLGKALRQIAQLIRADLGLEVAFAECSGWDTHVQQGTANGNFARPARDLALSIGAFWKDIEPYQDDVVLMTMTEFGRTVAENGSGGTDHGRASCMFVLGNSVAGGSIYGTVPPLAPENLADGRDLPVTTDFRSLFADVAGTQFGIRDDRLVFPEWEGKRMKIMSA